MWGVLSWPDISFNVNLNKGSNWSYQWDRNTKNDDEDDDDNFDDDDDDDDNDDDCDGEEHHNEDYNDVLLINWSW